MICESANRDALIALRLTNKSISSPATKTFASQHLSSLSVIMTAPCLERLVEICEHPTFGPEVRRICITSSRMTHDHIKELMDRWNDLIDYSDGDHSSEITWTEVMIHRCMDRYKDEQTLEQ
jgi:hypothetical protein